MTSPERFSREDNYSCHANQWPRASGPIIASAVTRITPGDFIVREELGIKASGNGEHALLTLQKTNLTTTMVAEAIARLAGVSSREVSYAGLKDKRAVTQQTFSVHLPGKADPDWTQLAANLRSKVPGSDLSVLDVQRHQRKIKSGAHRSNEFEITLRNIACVAECTSANWLDRIRERILSISEKGVPNYFGEQRFGFQGENVNKAVTFLNAKKRLTRSKRSIYLSAIRAFLFNQLLALRVNDGNWCNLLEGDYLSLSGSQSFFPIAHDDIAALITRVQSGDLHISGLLYGEDYQLSRSSAGEYEARVANCYPQLLTILHNARLKMARRAFRLIPEKLEYHLLADDCLRLDFKLPPGSYATAVMRELFDYSVAGDPE